MTEPAPIAGKRTETAFLDANVIRGQLTNDILLSLAEREVFNPRWSQTVLDEMRRNRPGGKREADRSSYRCHEVLLSESDDHRHEGLILGMK